MDASLTNDLFGILALAVFLVALRQLLRGSKRAPRRGAPRSSSAPRRCQAHKNKREFATQADADGFIEWTQRRHAAGRWSGAPMDHSYRCPASQGDHWHVSSKPRRF
jgi:hypothetical protein